jgi:hypothetical protein
MTSRARLLSTALFALACSSRPAASEPVEPPVPEAPPADALEASVRALGAQIAPYMQRMETVQRGELAERGARDFSAFLRPGWCYKVVGMGGDGIEDLDLRIHDTNNVLLERDIREDRSAVLGADRPICPVENGTYRVEIRAQRGHGPYVVQMYESM